MHNVLEKHGKFSKAGGGTKRIPRRAKEPPEVQMRVAADEIRVRMWMELKFMEPMKRLER